MWELDHKEGWALKNRCFWTVVLEKTLENPLDCKIIKPVNPNGNQPWTFIGMIDAKAEAAIFWPPDAKSWLTKKDPDAGKDWRLKEKGATEDETIGWHHQFSGHEFEQSPGVSEGQGSLTCWSFLLDPNHWDCKESDTNKWVTEQLQQDYTASKRQI